MVLLFILVGFFFILLLITEYHDWGFQNLILFSSFGPIQPSQITSLCKLHPGETATSGPLTTWLSISAKLWKPPTVFFLAAGASCTLPGARKMVNSFCLDGWKMLNIHDRCGDDDNERCQISGAAALILLLAFGGCMGTHRGSATLVWMCNGNMSVCFPARFTTAVSF